MDFKQNMKIGGSARETARDFYHKSEITLLGFCVYYKIQGVVKTKYVCFISENLSHDSFFVKEAIKELLKKPLFEEMNHLRFWSDCENHFRSKAVLYLTLKELTHEYNFISVKQDFFSEYHGKSVCDTHFSEISTALD